MGIYTFDFIPRTNSPPGAMEAKPLFIPLSQLPDKTGHKHLPFNKINIGTDDTRNILPMGFQTMDEGIKQWLSDIVVPTKDGQKKVTVRVPRSDRTVLIWQQELKEGRIRLPVISVHRNSETFHAEKFSPPYHRMRRMFADKAGTRLALIYRPRHYLLEYQITAWTEFKQDAEYIKYQMLTRFSPLAEIHIADEYLQGNLIMKFGSATDNSEIEAAKNTLAKVRYDFTLSAEGWLPLPEKLTPAILGKVQVLQDTSGVIYQAQFGRETVNI